MRYVAFIHGDTEPGFGISFPDFPGCVSAGDTIDEAIRRGTEALAFQVEGLIRDGEHIPEPRSVQDIEIDPDIAEWREGAIIYLVPLNVCPTILSRDGWDDAFRRMPKHGDDALFHEKPVPATEWDATEWEW